MPTSLVRRSAACLSIVGSIAWLIPHRAVAAPVAVCTARAIPTDSQVVTCPIDATATGRPLRFTAVFGGSHDDTRIQLDARLDGEPLACDAGSKTSLFAEDGIVGLDCGFRVAPRSDGATLEVSLTVHHAQFVSASLDPQ